MSNIKPDSELYAAVGLADDNGAYMNPVGASFTEEPRIGKR